MSLRRTATILALSFCAALTASAQRPAGGEAMRGDGLVVTPAWLAARLTDPNVLVVEVVQAPAGQRERIPGTRELPYRRMVTTRDGLSSELPAADTLKALFEALGISDNTHVVVYAEEAPMATRFLMTLASIGHARASYLDGGLPRWKAEQHPTVAAASEPRRGSLTVTPAANLVATADWLQSRVGKPGLSLIDTRTLGEYNGTGNRSGMPSAGHLAGARQLEWEWLFETDRPLQLKSRDALKQLYAERVREGDTVVSYCWVGYRASATWFAARLLSYDAKFYDGSYQDWQQRKLPVTLGATP